jgi:AraC family transcriptional regulator
MPQQSRLLRAKGCYFDDSAARVDQAASCGNRTAGALVRTRPREVTREGVIPCDHAKFEDKTNFTLRQLELVAGIVEQLACKRSAAHECVISHAALSHREASQGEHTDTSLRVVAETEWFEQLRANAVVHNPNDRVINFLSSALATAEEGNDHHCVDALRLAMVIRLLGLRSDTPAAARQSEPDGRGRQVRALQKWRLKRAVEYIDTHLSAKVSLLDLAAVAGLSRMHFASQFRVATGLRPHEFLLRRRIRRAEELLRDTETSIVEIALTVGFQTQAHFTTVFKRFVGCTPCRWRVMNHGRGVPQAKAKTVEVSATAPD